MPWEWLIPVALIPGFWAGLCVLIARMTGWGRLANRFRADREPLDGETFRWSFIRLGWSDYNGCVTIRISPEGVYLAIWPLFVGHPPLLIPWNELRMTDARPRGLLARAQFEVSPPSICKLTLPWKVVEASRQWLEKESETLR